MKIDERCFQEFPSITKGINNAIFNVNGECLEVFDVSNAKESPSWEHFVKKIPSDLCCFVFAHFNYLSETDGVERSKFINILWSPSSAGRKDKMTASFFSEKVLMSLGGLGCCRLQAGCVEDLSENIVKEKVLRRITVK